VETRTLRFRGTPEPGGSAHPRITDSHPLAQTDLSQILKWFDDVSTPLVEGPAEALAWIA
jgi:hypothetical protein